MIKYHHMRKKNLHFSIKDEQFLYISPTFRADLPEKVTIIGEVHGLLGYRI